MRDAVDAAGSFTRMSACARHVARAGRAGRRARRSPSAARSRGRCPRTPKVEPDVPVKSPPKNRPVRRSAVVVGLRVDPGLALHHDRAWPREPGALAVDDARSRAAGTPSGTAGSRPPGARPSRRRAPAAPASTGHAVQPAAQHPARRRRSRAAGSRGHHAAPRSGGTRRARAPASGRAGASRTSARVRGNRQATSETNSRAVISANHQDPNTSKSPARRGTPRRAGGRAGTARRARASSGTAGSASRPRPRAPASAAGSAPCASSAGCARRGRRTARGTPLAEDIGVGGHRSPRSLAGRRPVTARAEACERRERAA